MRYILTIKGGIALAVVVMLLAAAAIYAGHLVFDVNITGNVQLAISTADPLEVYLVSPDDSLVLLSGGDTINFGLATVDYWDTAPTPLKKVAVKNTANTPELVIVTGDLGDGILPLFGLTKASLKPAPDNEFRLEPAGMSGDMTTGWLGLKFLDLSTGSKRTTIIFRATAITASPLLNKIDFENPSLGQPCRLSDVNPLRNEYLQSHGVEFHGDTPTSLNGLAVLHECSNFGGITSHTTGDYFLAGIDGVQMLNGGNPFLPEVITFIHPVSEIWFYACSCGSSFSYTLFLHGYDGPDATGTQIVSDSRLTTTDWQLWKVTAPENKAFRSVKLSGTVGARNLVVDDLEWKWAE